MDDGLSRCTLHGLVLLWPGFDIFVWKYSLIVWIFFIDFLTVFFVNLGTSYGCGSFLVISKVFILPCCWIILALSDVDISELFYFWNFFFFSTEIFVMS